MTQATYDLIVIGEGISGLICASHAARAGLKVATFEVNLFGGLVLNVNELDGYPEDRATSGANLASELMRSNAEAGVASIQEEVTSIRAGGGAFEVATVGGSYSVRQVVIASGARLKKLGVSGEDGFEGRGVSQCADCDGPMYRNEDVVVVGGGDSALQEALVLAKFCRKLHLIHRGGNFRAKPHFVERVQAEPAISIIWNATVEAILGGKMVECVRVKHADGHAEELACTGVFPYVGLDPSAGFAPPEVERDERGFIRTNERFETTVPGIRAIGAVRSGYSGLLRDAIVEARHAADAAAGRRERS